MFYVRERDVILRWIYKSVMMQSYATLVVSPRKYGKTGVKLGKANYQLADSVNHANRITRAEALTLWGMDVRHEYRLHEAAR